MKPQSSLLYSQEPVTCLYPEPEECSLQPNILLLPDVSILCSKLCTDLPVVSCLLDSHQNPVSNSILLHPQHMLHTSEPHWFDRHDIWHRVHITLSHTAEVIISHRWSLVKTEELPKYMNWCILECIVKKIHKNQGYKKT
jgi:hypothetical protein